MILMKLKRIVAKTNPEINRTNVFRDLHYDTDSLFVIGVDMYNHKITGDVTMTLCCERSDPHHIPCVIIIGNLK